MSATLTVTVAEGRAVRDPDTMQLLPEGEVVVPNNQFYQRRLNDGDVVLVEAPPETQDQGA
jgi:Protein of unknown function (DUF2635)